MKDPKEIVRSGYDTIAERYADWAATFETPELQWIEELLSDLEAECDVLVHAGFEIVRERVIVHDEPGHVARQLYVGYRSESRATSTGRRPRMSSARAP